MAVEAPLFTTLKDVTVTFTDGSGTPIVYTFNIPEDGISEGPKRQREDIVFRGHDGVPISVRKSGNVAADPFITFTNLRIRSHSLGTTAISTSAGSLVAIVRGTGPTSWTNTDSTRAPDHVTGTLLIATPDVGGCKGESRSYAKARIVTNDITEKTDQNGRFIPSLTFMCIDEPTITVNA